MKIAILSDIHSNKFALTSTLKFLEGKHIDKYIFLGDFFGYYPWAAETFTMIECLFERSIFILGNHDQLICLENKPIPTPEYWDVIVQNKNALPQKAKDWLFGLNPNKEVELDGITFKLFHGTPDNPSNGRFYPDNDYEYDWFPNSREILLLGHTHYPILKKTKGGGLIVNPGSVGQPRDGNMDSAFCIINTEDHHVEFFRVPYLINDAISELVKMNWYPRAINSLKNTR